MPFNTPSAPGIRTTNLPRKSAFITCLCLMATAVIACGGDKGTPDAATQDTWVAPDNGTAIDLGESMRDISASLETTDPTDTSISGDGTLYDDPGYPDLATLDYGVPGDVPSGDDALDEKVFVDAYDGDWYVYDPGTPNVEIYAEYPDFSWSHTCSGVGQTIPPVLVQISHVPVEDLPDWIDAIATAIRIERLSDNTTVAAAVTPVEVPVCDNGGCRNPAMAVYELQFAPDTPLADDWYQMGMDPAPELVASAITANSSLRFRPGHDARVGMIRYQAQAGYENYGSFNIVFTEMMHSTTLGDFPTLRVAQGESTDLDCDYYTDNTMWLTPGQPQFYVRSCTGLDITQSFTIYLGGTLMTIDGKKLPPAGGEARIDVAPSRWNAPCVGIWSCNEIPVQ